jgi:hypothetical protein
LTELIEMAEAVRAAAGWSGALKERNETVEFELTEDLSFSLSRHGERLAVFTADLGPWPDEERQADELARHLGGLAAASFRGRNSILSIASGRYGLHLSFDPDRVSLDEVPKLCECFLNDLDWWRHNRDPRR